MTEQAENLSGLHTCVSAGIEVVHLFLVSIFLTTDQFNNIHENGGSKEWETVFNLLTWFVDCTVKHSSLTEHIRRFLLYVQGIVYYEGPENGFKKLG